MSTDFQKTLSADVSKLGKTIPFLIAAVVLLVMADTQLYPVALAIGVIALIYVGAEGLLTPILTWIGNATQGKF